MPACGMSSKYDAQSANVSTNWNVSVTALMPSSAVLDTMELQNDESFERRGPGTLLFAKFVPGLQTVAPPLAGAGKGQGEVVEIHTAIATGGRKCVVKQVAETNPDAIAKIHVNPVDGLTESQCRE